jgi:SAM-dependent methyltransferase
VERPDWVGEGIDMDRPSAARAYDYLLGGNHNFAVDRELARQAMSAMPDVAEQAQANRAFLHRTVRYLTGQGVRQFLDLGSGIPTVGNVHEVAQAADPTARVVYVDIDPIAIEHAHRLLADNPGAIALRADLRRPEQYLDAPEVRDLFDFDQPVAVLMLAVLHAVPDRDDPEGVVARIRDALAPGSYLVLAHGTDESRPEESAELVRLSRRTPTTITPRPRARIGTFFDGFELVEPGLTWVSAWRPEDGETVESPERSANLGAVGVKR